MTKRRKTAEEPARAAAASQQQQQDEDFIPLPIQTFLWRQTSPFVRPLLGKARDLAQIEQRDACKLFERIIITNNIWGQSPSLTDAIASIDRWRLIKVSFPFVLQCTAALLNNKLIRDANFNRLAGNEAKMMYTLQWILMNASEECADSENEAKQAAASTAAMASSLLKPSAAATVAHSQGSTSSVSTGLEHQQQQQQRLGSTSSGANQSIMVPAASAAAGVVAVGAPHSVASQIRAVAAAAASQQQPQVAGSSSSVSPLGSSTPTKPLTPVGALVEASHYLLPVSSIQMFVYYFAPIMDELRHSDFLSSNQRLEIGAGLWEPLFERQLPHVQCLRAPVSPIERRDQPAGAFFAAEPAGGERRRSSTLAAAQEAQFGDVFIGSAQGAGQQAAEADPEAGRATYLDVAVLRCLFVADWQEAGVHWALGYLANRLAEPAYAAARAGRTEGRACRAPAKSRSIGALDRPSLRRLSRRLLEHKAPPAAKTRKRPKKPKRGRFLRVEEPDDSSDSTDGHASSKSPVRRLSFSSGMATLASQLRKTSRRAKKAAAESSEAGPPSPSPRRSSSPEEMAATEAPLIRVTEGELGEAQLERLVRSQSVPGGMRLAAARTRRPPLAQAESLAAAHYLDAGGRVEPLVVLKVAHQVSRRPDACSGRVCDLLLSLLERLLELDVLGGPDSQQQRRRVGRRALLVHRTLMDVAFRLLQHLGCPNGCAGGRPASRELRSRLRALLLQLADFQRSNLVAFVQELVVERPLQQVLDVFHGLLGFCKPDYLASLRAETAPDADTMAADQSLEGLVVASSLKQLVGRLAGATRELRQPELAGLHLDIRRLISFARAHYEGVFRSIVLSALIDSTRLLSGRRQSTVALEPPEPAAADPTLPPSEDEWKPEPPSQQPSDESPQQRASLGSGRLGPALAKRDGGGTATEGGLLSLSKAKRKLEQVFGPASKWKQPEEAAGEEPAPPPSRRASTAGRPSVGSLAGWPAAGQLRSRALYVAVQRGMGNFGFLMESCPPGDFLEPALLAALLDLRGPVAIRAAVFLECANFVHRCNRGQWPWWMRTLALAPSQATSTSGARNSNSGAPGAARQRKSSVAQRVVRNNTLMYRAAGRAFYSWAEAVGARLEELLLQEAGELELANDESDSQQQVDADFFQVNPTDQSPFALKLAACQLLLEVTTFLRETYRYLPPSLTAHHAGSAGAKLGDKLSSIYDVSRAVTANRRWSMALSSLGFGQLPAALGAISAAPATRLPGAIAEHPERRISFILHETSDEALEGAAQPPAEPAELSPLAPSVNTSEQQQEAMRKLTAGRHLSQSSASSAVVVAAATCLLRSSGVIEGHRRKSIKLKRSSGERERLALEQRRARLATAELDEEAAPPPPEPADPMRRTDSLRSRRRVSGISEKSDTSEPGPPPSGDESTGAASGEEAAAAAAAAAAAQEAAAKLEADDGRLLGRMPWFRALGLANGAIDCQCAHFPSCTSRCYKLHQAACKRLVAAVQSIYQAPDSERDIASSLFESRLSNLLSLGRQQQLQQQQQQRLDQVRAGSDCSAAARRPQPESASSTNSQAANEQVGVSASQMTDAIRALTAAKARKRATAQRVQEEPPMVRYVRLNVKNLLHCPMSAFLKGAVILQRDTFAELTRFTWHLLLEDDQQLARTAAVGFIVAAIKNPQEAAKLLLDELESSDASRKLAAISKFHVIWEARYQCWPRLEDGAFVHFKMAPPSIEFTLPSPKIAQESKPVVDPPWMPKRSSNVEEVTIGQDQTVQRSFVTATKTRRKQQIELVSKALREKHDKLREERELYHITSVPITLYAAYEPTLAGQQSAAGALGTVAGQDDAAESSAAGGQVGPAGAGSASASAAQPPSSTGNQDADQEAQQESRALSQMKSAQALFPTCLCQAAIVMINLLDDSRVTYEGAAVYELASKVIWSCLVEDPALFLRHFFERLTRQNQTTIFQVLRRLIRFMPRLPAQAAYTLYNYLIGFVIYYIRCPVESSQKLIADTLSVLCLVVPSVYGLFLKDLKQILRKEQCDHNLLITANVPSAKKIIIHGSDSSEIPSQFPIDESTQFYHILIDSLDFFGVQRHKQNEYFLVDCRTQHMHNLHAYVRDYYSFKRSQHPQLQLINMEPSKAFDQLQRQELVNQFLEFGKVSMSLSIVKSSYMAVQRVLFLHEELMKLPSFPRKALETNFSLFRGPLGLQAFSMDRLHKICWVRVIARMFELTSGFFLQLTDIHLFLNAVSGIFVLHCEEASVLRLCLATYINAAHQFKNIFATDGFMPIMATIVQVYSNHQNNQLLCRSIEFVCKQFYIMHRKPFLLQLFGAVASRLNTAELACQSQASNPLGLSQPTSVGASTGLNQAAASFVLNDPTRISPAALFRLLQSLEKAFKDPLDILELVEAEKPLRAVDFCYQQDKEAIEILDIISLCVTVTAYASESARSTQMLIILENVVPLYMRHLQASTSRRAGQSQGKQAHKEELQKIQSISICIRTLIVNCEGLTRTFSGPTAALELRGSSIRRPGTAGTSGSRATEQQQQQQPQHSSAGSPAHLLHADECSLSEPGRSGAGQPSGATVGGPQRKQAPSSEELELTRAEFIVPRDTLLSLVADFLALSTGRLVESAKKYVDLHQKHASYELLDVKSHLRLAEVANSLLKFASTDPSVMACRGLTRYLNEILPNTEWRQEAIRPALIMILKRLDKTFNRIAKKSWVKRSTDWEGAKQLLRGAYLTFIKHPYIVHLPHLKSLIACCQNIVLSDGTLQAAPSEQTGAPVTAGLPAERPSGAQGQQGFSSVTIRLIAMQLLQTGDSQTLEGLVASSLGTPDKLEALMLNLIYPMCIRVCSGAREAPKLRPNDIAFVLNLVLALIAPHSSSSRPAPSAAGSPKGAADTSQFILSKITTTIGSTQTGASALGIVGGAVAAAGGAGAGAQAHFPGAAHPDGQRIGFLGLKILCVCFEAQLAAEWIRVSRLIRDLALQAGQPSATLWDFLDFVTTYRFPLFVLLLPIIKCQLAQKLAASQQLKADQLQCQQLIRAKIRGPPTTVCRSKSFLFVSLTAELRMLKEQLLAKRRLQLEGERRPPPAHWATAGAGQPGTNPLSPAADLTDGFTAYHRLSAAIASFAQAPAGPAHGQTGAALKGACFAAQLATSAPLGAAAAQQPAEKEPSVRLSAAKSREEARTVMNLILRRTSYPHNQAPAGQDQRKGSGPPSPGEPPEQPPLIMDPAMLMAAFPAPRKSQPAGPDGSGILKQLIQTIDRQNQRPAAHQSQLTMKGSRSQNFAAGHRHVPDQ